MNALALIALSLLGVEVTPTQILGHGDPVPRFASIPGNNFVVPPGVTMPFPTSGTFDAIEIAGTAIVSRTADTDVRFQHLTILPGGTLDGGTAADPVLKIFRLTVRDVPIDQGTSDMPGKDPYAFGNGILVFGNFFLHGKAIEKSKTYVSMDAVAGGAQAIAFRAGVPAGWSVGDELLLPDMRACKVGTFGGFGDVLPRRESPVSIAAISGNVVTLSKPLDFEHMPVTKPDGTVVYWPVVASKTRNIVVCSENPQGTRGHVMAFESANMQVSYAGFLGLGRTLAIPVDSTSHTNPGWHIGTNPIARYALHWHHVKQAGLTVADDGFIGRAVGCFLDGTDIAKWGLVDHATHFLLLEDNIVDRCVGAGISLEDGYETGSLWNRNLVMGCKGNTFGQGGQRLNGLQCMVLNGGAGHNIPGGEGAGFWLHGPHIRFTNNLSINNAVGCDFDIVEPVMNQSVPDVPGGPLNTPLDPTVVGCIENSGNALLCNSVLGLETWKLQKAVQLDDLLCAYNGSENVQMGGGFGGHLNATNLRIYGKDNWGVGIKSSAAYTTSINIDGGEILGVDVASGDADQITLKNLVVQSTAGFYFGPARAVKTVLDNCKFLPAPDGTKKYITLGGFNNDWKVGEKLPNVNSVSPWNQKQPNLVVTNWQQEAGKDYILFERQQLRSKPAYPGFNGNGDGYCPEAGLTMGACFDKYSFAYGGAVIDDAIAVSLEGFDGVAQPGTSWTPPVARNVLISPNQVDPVVLNPDNTITLWLVNTGDVAFDPGSQKYTMDGAGPFQGSNNGRINSLLGVGPGLHTVATWRTDASGSKITGSDLTFAYTVPGGPPPPPPPPLSPELQQCLADKAALQTLVDLLTSQNLSLRARLDQIKMIAQ